MTTDHISHIRFGTLQWQLGNDIVTVCQNCLWHTLHLVDLKMKPPNKPKEEDCCNSGCNPCIYDVYDKQLKLYERFKVVGDATIASVQNGISEIEYTTFILFDLFKFSNSHIVLKFKMVTSNRNIKRVWWNPGDHFLLKYTSSENNSCSRAYTPIKFKVDTYEDYDFLIVVKRYEHGLVSKYLFNLRIGEETLWRGPYGFYKMESNRYTRIIMLAQGTGIAPFISIIDEILSNEEDMTKIVLYFSCKNMDEILFRKELYEYQSYWNFSYTIFLSSTSEDIREEVKYQEPVVFNRFNIKHLDSIKPFTNDQIMLCGSEQFMKEYKSLLSNNSENIVIF